VAQALGLAWVVGALTISARRFGGGHAVLPALLVAGACVTAVLSLFAAPLVGDAALARSALAGDGPFRALWRAALRFARRPAAFLALALALALSSVATHGSLQIASSAALGVARGAPAIVVAGSQLWASALGAVLTAMLELWRLGAIAALACSDPNDAPA
jgi:hypothetical protein